MDTPGYTVSRYLFATSSINLPKFFKKSLWPQVWSKKANWIGYIAVSITRDGSTVPVSVLSFSGPRVGNSQFKERLENTLGVKVLRVYNVHDVVPMAPGFIVNEHVSPALTRLVEAFPWSYSHVGTELKLDHKNSPFLKDTSDRVCAHNLEALLDLIDGYQGKGEHFSLEYERDIALVNKACDFLKDEYQIPPNWRQYENKGMVRAKDGRWIQPERPLIEELSDDIHRHLRQLGLADQ